jgi:TonB-dependent SusC/RagA subfamily outer membrane receptor
MDRLVVTATGTNRMREIGNAVGQINAASEVEQAQPASVSDLLTGRLANVTVQQNTGSVGAASSITVRGAGSLSLSNRPIVYVDGVRIRTEGLEGGVRGQDYSRFTDISPEDIESIDVVKGPAAATLYGTEASSGVIRITTKRGENQETRYSLSIDYGGLRDNTEYEPTQWNPRSLLGPAAKDTVYSMNLLESQSPFRTGQIYSVQGNARGCGDVVRFFATGELSEEEGFVPTNSSEKLQARTNFTLTPTSELEATFTNSVTVGTTRLPEANNSPYGWVALSYIGFPFYDPIEHRDPNANGQGELIDTCPLNVEIARLTGAPLSALGRNGCEAGPGFAGRTFGDLETIDNRRESARYVGSASVRWSPVDFWNTRATIGYDLFSERIRSLFPVDPERPFGERSTGELTKRKIDGQNFTAELTSTVNYGLTEDLSAHTSVGTQYFQEMTDGDSVVAKQFPAGSPSVRMSSVPSTATPYSPESTSTCSS